MRRVLWKAHDGAAAITTTTSASKIEDFSRGSGGPILRPWTLDFALKGPRDPKIHRGPSRALLDLTSFVFVVFVFAHNKNNKSPIGFLLWAAAARLSWSCELLMILRGSAEIAEAKILG